MVAIIWTDSALADLDTIADYIALDKPDAAARLVRRVFEHIEALGQHPQLGSRIPELRPVSRYRQLVEPPCRIFYRHDAVAKKLFILGVMRGEKLFRSRILRQRDQLE